MIVVSTGKRKKLDGKTISIRSSTIFFIIYEKNCKEDSKKIIFKGMSRDLLAWSSSLRRSMITEEKVSDAASAQMLKAEHDDLKAEIETRDKTFR